MTALQQEVTPSKSLTHTHTHLSSEDPADTNDAKDVEDRRANDGPHPHIAMGDKDTCIHGGSQSESAVTPTIWDCLSTCTYYTVCVCVCVFVPMTDAKSSGAELPAAMKVAPATSSLRSNFCRNKAKMGGLNQHTSIV